MCLNVLSNVLKCVVNLSSEGISNFVTGTMVKTTVHVDIKFSYITLHKVVKSQVILT